MIIGQNAGGKVYLSLEFSQGVTLWLTERGIWVPGQYSFDSKEQLMESLRSDSQYQLAYRLIRRIDLDKFDNLERYEI